MPLHPIALSDVLTAGLTIPPAPKMHVFDSGVSMKNLLQEWYDNTHLHLERKGYTLTIATGPAANSMSLDIDGETFVGTICHWSPDVFEFQFNACASGEVIVLETVRLGSLEKVVDYCKAMLVKVDMKEQEEPEAK